MAGKKKKYLNQKYSKSLYAFHTEANGHNKPFSFDCTSFCLIKFILLAKLT